jgi:hypothetical protein
VSSPPPEFNVEFVEWLRGATERAWSSITERTLDDYRRAGVGGTSWRRNTRWRGGLSDAEIDSIAHRYDLEFPQEHRLFLRTLHSTMPQTAGATFAGGHTLQPVERPGFYDWLRDEDAIRERLAWPLEGILFDVEQNNLWIDSWGRRPEEGDARKACVARLVSAAPKLIPIFGHRFLVSVEPHVVLSIYQSDIIVFGTSLRDYLLVEFAPLIGEHPRVPESVEAARLPFWGELLG